MLDQYLYFCREIFELLVVLSVLETGPLERSYLKLKNTS